jgi:hypothetical protein
MKKPIFKIEKKIPLPKSHRQERYKYPYNDMKVGDSFLVKGDRRKMQRRMDAEYGG